MRAGDLRQRVIIQIAQKSQNALGEWVDTWTTWATVWAAIEPNTGRRYYEALQASSEVSGVVRIRYRDGVLPTMRLLYGSRVLEIVSIVHPKEARQELHLMYKEKLD